MKRLSLMLVMLLAVAGCETGHVIEITMPWSQTDARAEQIRIVTDCLRAVALKLDLEVVGPLKGPGDDIEFGTRDPNKGRVNQFFIRVQFSERVSIVFRNLLPQVNMASAERAFSLFTEELNRRGLVYDVRRV